MKYGIVLLLFALTVAHAGPTLAAARIAEALAKYPLSGAPAKVDISSTQVSACDTVPVQLEAAKPRTMITRIKDGVHELLRDDTPHAPVGAGPRGAVRWEGLCATTDALGRGGQVGHPGPRGNWRARSSDAYIALPDKALRGRTFWLQCMCQKHGLMSPMVPAPVHDIGPWSVGDPFVREHLRPWAESGKSDKYRHVPGRGPAVDLSPAMWAKLGHPEANGNYSGYVDLVALDELLVPVPTDRARRAD